MLGIAWFFFWQLVGWTLSFTSFPDKKLSVRLWLGSVFGSVGSAWAPIPFSFFFNFTPAAHTYGAAVGVIVLMGLFLVRRKMSPSGDVPNSVEDRPLLGILVLLGTLFFVLLCSHTLQEVDGALYTGQCTYGDMCMHLSFISSMAVQGIFPFEYSILPGARLCYPFLCDSISASLFLLDTSLRTAYILPMMFAFLQVVCGVWFLAQEICSQRGGPVLAAVFFFLNGGLGMIYFTGEYSLHELFTGFYKTPTNLTAKGIRWVNVIADMLLPQRATLFGWAALFAALYLLLRAVYRRDEKCWLPAGILGGLLPMIHTHSYLALGLMAACWLIGSLVRDGWSRKWLRGWLLFGLPAVIIALPQVFYWTLRSAGGNEQFLRIHLGWVAGDTNDLWFWFKNVGVVAAVTIPAFIVADREQKTVFSGALLIFALCEIIVFQPNEYDNNKLLYVAYLFACILCADFLLSALEKLRSEAGRAAILACVVFLSSNAALFTLGREVVSGIPKYGYRHIAPEEVKAAEFIAEYTEPGATFLTDDNHNNAVAMLTGRNIVCGSASFLYFHGLDYSGRQQIAELMLTNFALFEEYKRALHVDYVYISSYERAIGGCIEEYFQANYPAVYSLDGVSVYDVRGK